MLPLGPATFMHVDTSRMRARGGAVVPARSQFRRPWDGRAGNGRRLNALNRRSRRRRAFSAKLSHGQPSAGCARGGSDFVCYTGSRREVRNVNTEFGGESPPLLDSTVVDGRRAHRRAFRPSEDGADAHGGVFLAAAEAMGFAAMVPLAGCTTDHVLLGLAPTLEGLGAGMRAATLMARRSSALWCFRYSCFLCCLRFASAICTDPSPSRGQNTALAAYPNRRSHCARLSLLG